ncbi:MAG: glycosyltransferase family 4 protein [Limnobacter sp.]|nr:glycosyltransferase family 4 protein [Limnobacter sp.]
MAEFNRMPGVQVELIKVPSPERNIVELLKSYQTFSTLDLNHFDAVISTKYPAWMVSHPRHILYMQHCLRGLYDTYHLTGLPIEMPSEIRETPELAPLLRLIGPGGHPDQIPIIFEELARLQQVLQTQFEKLFQFPGPLSRALIHALDERATGHSRIKKFAAISHNVKGRQAYFPPGVQVEVIHHPSDLPTFEANGSDCIFTVSRLDNAKRIAMLIKAFRMVKTSVPFLIAGSGPEELELKRLAHGDERIQFLGRLTDQEIIQCYQRALFVPFVPYDEDYGLITVEAMQASRAVLTTKDSGGVNEFVVSGSTGYSVEPTTEALAAAMQAMLDNPEATLQMGALAKAKVAHVTWKNTCEKLYELVSDASKPPNTLSDPPRSIFATNEVRRKILVVSPFRITPPTSGGQNRVYYLYKAMSEVLDITILSLDFPENEAERIEITPYFREVVIPINQELKRLHHNLHGRIKVDCGDVVLIDGIFLHHEFIQELKALSQDSEWVIASHPYLFRAIEAVYRGKVAYDAHNIEQDMKSIVLGPALTGKANPQDPEVPELAKNLLGATSQVENDLLERASMMVACSRTDLTRFESLYKRQPPVCAVAPNGVDIAGIQFVDLVEKFSWQKRLGLNAGKEFVLFSGSWHGPNIRAMNRVVDLATECPDIQFGVMGSICKHPNFQNLPANLLPFGLVSESEKKILLCAASVMLNPMEEGSGTNLKMLEYCAAGGSVISTPFGGRGLTLIPDVEFVTASPDGFSSALRTILNMSIDDRQEMASRARRRVEQDYDWHVCAQTFSEQLRWH